MTYGMDTSLTLEPGPFACGFIAGRALCSDGKVRSLRFGDGIADTFFSVPCRVSVRGKTVSGYCTVETLQGWTTTAVPEDPTDPAVVKFVAVEYGRNASMLPSGAFKSEEVAA